jgi:hypothetical protein
MEMIDAITSKGYCLDITPTSYTVWHRVAGDMAMFGTLFEAWKYAEGWGQNEP